AARRERGAGPLRAGFTDPRGAGAPRARGHRLPRRRDRRAAGARCPARRARGRARGRGGPAGVPGGGGGVAGTPREAVMRYRRVTAVLFAAAGLGGCRSEDGEVAVTARVPVG